MTSKPTGMGELLNELKANTIQKKAAEESDIAKAAPMIETIADGSKADTEHEISEQLKDMTDKLNAIDKKVADLSSTTSGGAMPEDQNKAGLAGATPAAAPAAVPAVETPAVPPIPAPAPAPAAATDNLVEAKFELGFTMNKDFSDSFFYAKQGKDAFKTVRMHRVVPIDVQNAVYSSIASGKTPEGIPGPEALVAQLKSQGVDSIEKFAAAMLTLESQANERNVALFRSAKQRIEEPLIARNEGEVEAPKDAKPGSPAAMAVLDEKGKGEKLPSPLKNSIHDYYARLPGKSGGELLQAFNPKSGLSPEILAEQIGMLRKAAEELEAKAKSAEDRASKAEGALASKEKSEQDSKNEELKASIVDDLLDKGLIAPESEQKAISVLLKIDSKELAKVAELIKLLSKGMGEEKKLPAKPVTPKLPTIPDMGAPELPNKKSATIPQMFLQDKGISDPNAAAQWLRQNWNRV